MNSIKQLADAICEDTGNRLQEMGNKMKAMGTDIKMSIDGKEVDTE